MNNDDLLNSMQKTIEKKNILNSVHPSTVLFEEPCITHHEKWHPSACSWLFSFLFVTFLQAEARLPYGNHHAYSLKNAVPLSSLSFVVNSLPPHLSKIMCMASGMSLSNFCCMLGYIPFS